MTSRRKRLKIGIVGCGAIGSRIADAITHDLKQDYELSALFDIHPEKSKRLETSLSLKGIQQASLKDLIKRSDLIVEAVNAPDTGMIIEEVLKAKKHVLAMSVGKLLKADKLFSLANKNHCQLLLPSGAIAGIDAIKAASLAQLESITLTTRKPTTGFMNNSYLEQNGIDPSALSDETVIFDGDVESAVKFFPQNINVAATLSLAAQSKNKIRVRILTSPHFTQNSHEIEMIGDFGRMVTRTDNLACPDNVKTSYLAVLSGIQSLKQFCECTKIGT